MGLSGPDAGWRSYGNGLVAMSGIAAHTGFDGRMPQCLGTMHTDFTVPYFAAMQILAALHHRDRTGEGVYLELSQYESSVRLMDVELADVLNGGDRPRPHRQPLAVVRPARRVPGRRRRPLGRHRLPRRRRAGAAATAVHRRTDRRRSGGGVDRGRATAEEIVAALRAAGVPVSGVEDLADHMTSPLARRCGRRSTCPSGVTAKAIQRTDHVGRRAPAAAPGADVDGAHLRRRRRRARRRRRSASPSSSSPRALVAVRPPRRSARRTCRR